MRQGGLDAVGTSHEMIASSRMAQFEVESPTLIHKTYSCERNPNTKESYNLRIIALFVILGANLLMGTLPLLCKAFHMQSVFFYSSIFAGGVILASALVHLLEDAHLSLIHPCLGIGDGFPWAFTIAGGALMATFTIEYYVRSLIRGVLSKQHDLGEDLYKVVMLSHDFTAYVELGISNLAPAQLSIIQRAQIRDQKVAALMLEAGILFHSFFIGLDIGVTSDTDYVKSLLIAIVFQQGFEGLALGATYVRAHFSVWKYYMLLGIFALTAPVAIAIGIGLSQIYSDNDKLALGLEGAFTAVSAGILLYNSLVDILLPAFSSPTLLVGPLYARIIATICMFSGFIAMAALAKWT